MSTRKDKDAVRSAVREGYAQVATQSTSCCSSTSCCGTGEKPDAATQLVVAMGYDQDDLTILPQGANMGLSCGNPVALATLHPGETVLDLGSGGGFDVFIAGKKVGESGRAIGVDMTPEMLMKARKNIQAYRERTGLDNVEFRLGEIEHLPVADNSIDVIISNCVINLSPDKPQVWREIARILKPGGRVAVSDLALLQPLPEAVLEMVEALVGCIAGASLVSEIEQMANDAGLVEIVLEPKSEYIDSMSDWHDPIFRKIVDSLPEHSSISEYVVSLNISAQKPE